MDGLSACLRGIRDKAASTLERSKSLLNSLLVELHLRKNREMLSFIVDEIKKRSRQTVETKPSLPVHVWQRILQGIFSKLRTGFFFVVALLIILWFSPLHQWMSFTGLNLLAEDFESFFLVLWQVQASILGITFVIIMFLVTNLIAKIEVAYEKVSRRVIHEFISTSKIYGILPFCLCSIAYIGMSILFKDTTQTHQNLTLFLLNIASIFYLFHAAFNFFTPGSLEKLRLQHLKNEIAKSIDAEITRRLSENILMKQDVKFLRYFPLGVPDKTSLIAVRVSTTRPRVIKDINLNRLLIYSRIGPITLVKSLGRSLSKNDDVLCYVPEGTHSDDIQIIRSCFVLGEAEEKVVLFEALNGVQEEMREAIRMGNVTKLERVLDTYLSLLESFLQQISAYGIHYDSNAARSELDFGWRQIYEIIRSVEQAVEYAFKQGDLETIKWAMHFPREVATLAVEYGDHFLFQRFTSIFPFVYFLGSRVADTRIVDFAIDRSWRHLAEMSLHIRHLLENTTESERIGNLRDYTVEILLIFNSLLKATVDSKDFESFKKFGFALDGVLKYFEPEPPFGLQMALRSQNLTPDERTKLQSQLKVKQGLVEAKEEVEDTRKAIWFGLGAWTTRLYRKQELPQNDFLALFNDISARFESLEKLSSTLGLLTDLADVKFGWNFWLLSEKREGEVFFGSGIDTQEWMRWFYCIRGIQLTSTSIGEGTPIAPNRTVVDSLENVKAICGRILEEPEKWRSLLDDEVNEKMQNFLALHQRAAHKQIEDEKQWLIEQELSAQRIENFTNEVVEAWKTSANVRAIVEMFGSCMDLEPNGECKSIEYLGIRRFMDKAAFVEGWHISYAMYGGAFGKAMAKGENELLLKQICSPLKLHQKSKRDEIPASLRSAIMELRKSQFKPSVIFIKSRDVLVHLRESGEFKPRRGASPSEIDAIGCVGYFEVIPVFLLHESPSDCCVIDVAKLGVLNKCKLDSGSEPYLEISITRIDDESAKSMIDEDTGFLKNEEGEARSSEAAILDLKQRVIVGILEKIRFRVQEKNAGLRLEFSD